VAWSVTPVPETQELIAGHGVVATNLASWRGAAGDPAGAATAFEALLADVLRPGQPLLNVDGSALHGHWFIGHAYGLPASAPHQATIRVTSGSMESSTPYAHRLGH
jgi:hypothetical protein